MALITSGLCLVNRARAFRAVLHAMIKSEDVVVEKFVNLYIPNVMAEPFSLSKSYMEKVLATTGSAPLKEMLGKLDSLSEQEQTYILLVELLAHQFCMPVRWIETQDFMFTTHGVCAHTCLFTTHGVYAHTCMFTTHGVYAHTWTAARHDGPSSPLGMRLNHGHHPRCRRRRPWLLAALAAAALEHLRHNPLPWNLRCLDLPIVPTSVRLPSASRTSTAATLRLCVRRSHAAGLCVSLRPQ